MAVDLSDYTATLTRAVTPIGGTLGTTVTSSVLTGYLADAFWEARLDGFCKGYTCDEDGLVTQDSATDTSSSTSTTTTTSTTASATETEVDLPREMVAVIVLYAAIGILQRQVLNTQTQFRAKAGPVEFEQQSSATMLAEMLKQLAAQKERLLAVAEEQDVSTAGDVLMRDIVADRAFSPYAYALGGF